MAKVYGKSLSFCVRDILAGKVSLLDVEYIVTSTKFDNYLEAFDKYYEIYWSRYDRRVVQDILHYLFAFNKVIQPRKVRDDFFMNIANGWWSLEPIEVPARKSALMPLLIGAAALLAVVVILVVVL